MAADIGFALLLSALAGLSTTIGSLLALFVREPGPRVMTLTLGFSGGVMVLVSFVELLAVREALSIQARFGVDRKSTQARRSV